MTVDFDGSDSGAAKIVTDAGVPERLEPRPSSPISLRSIRAILFSFSTTCTGIRIVRPLSASARATACRIHHVAYVENL